MISIFLPIRKGSKRVKNKNLRPIGSIRFGLTEIKIKQIKKLLNILSKNRNSFLKIIEVIVSTDSEKVKKYIKDFSWVKIHHRSKKLADDDSIDELIKEIPKICKGKYILWTHVTSPFFNETDYEDFLKKFFKIKNKFSSAFSADQIQKFLINNKFTWISHDVKKRKWPKTQDLNKVFQANSAVFFSHISNYKINKNRLGKKPYPIITRANSSFDVDDMRDFNIVKEKYAFKK